MFGLPLTAFRAIAFTVALVILSFVSGWFAHGEFSSKSAVKQVEKALTMKASTASKDSKESEKVFKAIEQNNNEYAKNLNEYKSIKKKAENSVLDMALPADVIRLLNTTTSHQTNDFSTSGNDGQNTKH